MSEPTQSFPRRGERGAFSSVTVFKNIVKIDLPYDTIDPESRKTPKSDTNMDAGGMKMAGIIAGLIVCAFVYVIRESLAQPEEEI